ncbi:MAG: preprotein translocase subunit SecE [Clostridia bacterium]|nr:preprotein translocase subunit SecE [Clostridia bacterium]
MAEKTSSAKTASEKKTSPAKKNSGGFKRYFKELKGEFKKVTWPTWPALWKNTWVTIAMCAVVAAVVCVIDIGLDSLINLLLSI